MIITTKIGNIADPQWKNYTIDLIDLQWYELNKKIMRKFTQNKIDIGLQLPNTHSTLSHGDVLHTQNNTMIVINVLPCECISVHAHSLHEMAKICYEIGNRHAPLFLDPMDSHSLLLPMDKPLLVMLEKMGCHTKITQAQLIHPLGGAAIHHAHSHSHSHSHQL